MNYDETLSYIHSVSWKGSRPGLERITELCGMLGNPQKDLKFVHVAGTNGKGSVCSMLASVLREAGFKTGLFISPYVRFFNERMSVDGQMISNDALSDVTQYVKQYADRMKDAPTEFELITAIAFEYFKREKCDIAVLETGMGGRLDSTNIIEDPVCSVITGIALDHTAFLGDTIEKIAAEKAGIIKKERPVVYGGDCMSAKKVIEDRAERLEADFYFASADMLTNVRCSLEGCTFDFAGMHDLFVPLPGKYQPSNIATALITVGALRKEELNISDEAVREGLKRVYWPARFEILCRDPLMIYDGGHNPQGLRACIDSVKQFFGDKKVNILSGIMADKDVDEMIDIMQEAARNAFTVTPDNPRALSSRDYAAAFEKHGIKAQAFDTVEEGVKAALEASKRDNVPLIAVGSLYMYEQVRNAQRALGNS